MIGPGSKIHHTVGELHDIVSEEYICKLYLNIDSIPCKICSPIRHDKNPSVSVHNFDGKVFFYDFSNRSWMSLFTLLSVIWCTDFSGAVDKVYEDFCTKKIHSIPINKGRSTVKKKSPFKMDVVVREWRQHDVDYWNSFGISTNVLEWAYVKPISNVIFSNDDTRFAISADKYAYVFAEFKENRTSAKVYQPFNKKGFKWSSSHDSSVISLWSRLPSTGDRVCICSSMKDALCLMVHTRIPCIALQGEAYLMSDTAVNELKRRFCKVYVLFDNDEPGMKDAESLCSITGFTNITLPYVDGTEDVPIVKDIAELYQVINDDAIFTNVMLDLFN